ncbi:MAG: hypothetical protein O4749_06090 [Trichodesmium sp. St5_bin2_1]|nr:hypothetical protein [Trichodesmium sp. St5_bin2_1]
MKSAVTAEEIPELLKQLEKQILQKPQQIKWQWLYKLLSLLKVISD